MPVLSTPRQILASAVVVLLPAAFLGYLSWVAGVWSGALAEDVFGNGAYELVFVAGAASCLLRALFVPRERLGWGLLGLALTCYAAAEIYDMVVVTIGGGELPVPSLADVGWLAYCPLVYAGLIALVREQLGSFPAVRWLDGLIVGGAAAALAAALALDPIVATSVKGSTAEVATNLAYPVGDLTLLVLVVAVAALSGWRPGAGWLVLGAGLLVTAAADAAYLFQSAQGTYVEGSVVTAAWPFGVMLIAIAAWLPGARMRRPRPLDGRSAVVPTLAALVALGVLFADRYTQIPAVAAVISLLTLVGVIARLALAFRETRETLAASVHEALTDPLTGLANRRRFFVDLEAATAEAPRKGLCVLVLCDLDGFKAYNDSFGHPAGDSLLARVGGRLDAFARRHGARAYRLGGDEFCLLGHCTAAAAEEIVAGAVAALRERGEGFQITAAQGSVLIPSEAEDPEVALHLADRRMYANKNRERASAGAQSRDVLMSALRECRPQLHRHLVGVAALVARVSDELGIEGEKRDEIVRAAELHDVGKVAIPEAILNKAGPLDDDEAEFIRQHTMIGERIIASAPALVPVARLVRSTHERTDGSGYPDGLDGADIPIGSQIIAVCDAYEAMISERSYSAAIAPEAALAELRHCAGTQFDPGVVEAFCRVMDSELAADWRVPHARA
ncbi:MAG: diguanylate cyclase [Solirubrobacterales bacterium]